MFDFAGIDPMLTARSYFLHIIRLSRVDADIVDMARVGVVIGVNQHTHTFHPDNIFSAISCSRVSTDGKQEVRLVFQCVLALVVVITVLTYKFIVLGAFINLKIIKAIAVVMTLFNN